MASKQHKIISRVIAEIVKEYSFVTKNGYNCLEGDSTLKLSDPTSHSRAMIEYTPDFVIKRNLTTHTYYLIVFEIITDQADTKTMADVARVLACREIKRAIFVSTSGEKSTETERIVSTLTGLYKKRFQKTKKDDVVDIRQVTVYPSDSTDKIKKEILDYIKDILPKKQKKCIK